MVTLDPQTALVREKRNYAGIIDFLYFSILKEILNIQILFYISFIEGIPHFRAIWKETHLIFFSNRNNTASDILIFNYFVGVLSQFSLYIL